jgi:hypothetical protein
MVKNLRGYDGSASEVDNFDWWTPVEQEPLDILGEPPGGLGSGGGGGGLYFPDFQYGGDSLGGLNDALSQQIQAEIQAKIAAEIQAKMEADKKLQELAEYYAIAENKRKLAEAMEAERLRILADENERKNLSALEAERWRIANAELAAEAERQRLADEAEKQRLANLAAEAERKRLEAEAERQRLDDIAAEAEKKKLADEAQKKRLADLEAESIKGALEAEKALGGKFLSLKEDDIKILKEIATKPAVITQKQLEEQKLTQPVQRPIVNKEPINNNMLIFGLIAALVGVYIITKD